MSKQTTNTTELEEFTKHNIHFFYNLLEIGECDYLDFKEELSDIIIFRKSFKVS